MYHLISPFFSLLLNLMSNIGLYILINILKNDINISFSQMTYWPKSQLFNFHIMITFNKTYNFLTLNTTSNISIFIPLQNNTKKHSLMKKNIISQFSMKTQISKILKCIYYFFLDFYIF